jgi:hypothetical protein
MSNNTITIRGASSGDLPALERLAGRDSAVLPDDDFLIAQVGDEVWAAIGLCTGTFVADPFRPSAGVAELLRMRVERGTGHPQAVDPCPPSRHRRVQEALA